MRDFELLLALHQEGSLRAASDRLGCTPSALSHRLRDLESRLNRRLAVRQGRLVLAPEARALVPHIEAIFAELRLVEREWLPAPEPRRVGLSRLFLDGPYLDALGDLQAIGGPLWEFQSGHSHEVEGWVARGQVDIGLVRLERRQPHLAYQMVDQDKLVAVAPTGLRLAGEPTSWPWVLFSHRMGHGLSVRRALKEAGLQIEPRVVVDALPVAEALVIQGHVSVLPWSLVQTAISAGQLVEVALDGVIWPPRLSALVSQSPPPAWTQSVLRAIRRRLSPTGFSPVSDGDGDPESRGSPDW